MAEHTPDPEAPAKRGRMEIRTILALVAAVIVGGALYVLLFGSPNAENRDRDSLNANVGVTVGEPERR